MTRTRPRHRIGSDNPNKAELAPPNVNRSGYHRRRRRMRARRHLQRIRRSRRDRLCREHAALLDRDVGEALRHKPAAERTRADDPDLGRLIRLALAYIEFAAKNGPRWRALFEHRLSDDQTAPPWYIAEQNRIFSSLSKSRCAPSSRVSRRENGRSWRGRYFRRCTASSVSGWSRSLGRSRPGGCEALREQTAGIVGAIARGLRESASSS
jgi:hypothetical protein